MAKLALIGLFLMYCLNVNAQQLKRTKREHVETYPNGNIYKRVIIHETKNKYPDIFENYLKTTTTTYIYYQNKRIKSVEKSTEKIGDVGLNCVFVKYSLKQYDEKGRLNWQKEMRCDGKKETVWYFDHITGSETVSTIKRQKKYYTPEANNVE
jgi:hypothetical protein